MKNQWHDQNDLDLRTLYFSLFRYRRFILSMTVLVALVSLLAMMFVPTRYQSSVLLQIHHKQQHVLGSVSNTNQQLDLENISDESLSVLTALIESEIVLRPVIHALKLDVESNENKTYFFNRKNQSIVRKQENKVLNTIRKNLTITDLSHSSDNSFNKSALLRLTYTDENPQLVTEILDHIASSIQRQNIQFKQQEAQKTLNFLNQQLKVAETMLQVAELKLSHYRMQHAKSDFQSQTQFLLQHLSEINVQIDQLKLKQIDLQNRYTVHHPEVIAINQELKGLYQTRSQLNLQLQQLPALQQEALALNREVKVKNNLYMALLNQIHQLNVIKGGLMSDVDILATSSTPYPAPMLRLPVIAFLGALIGFLLACLSVFVMNIVSHPSYRDNIKNYPLPYQADSNSKTKPSLS